VKIDCGYRKRCTLCVSVYFIDLSRLLKDHSTETSQPQGQVRLYVSLDFTFKAVIKTCN